MMLNQLIIKHKDCLDIAFRLTKDIIIRPNKVILQGRWVNMAFVESFDIDDEDDIMVFDGLTDWFVCLEPNKKCIRYAKWKSLNL